MLFLPQGSTARAEASSAASSLQSSPHFFRVSLTYADSRDNKSQLSLLSHNFWGVSSLIDSFQNVASQNAVRRGAQAPATEILCL